MREMSTLDVIVLACSALTRPERDDLRRVLRDLDAYEDAADAAAGLPPDNNHFVLDLWKEGAMPLRAVDQRPPGLRAD